MIASGFPLSFAMMAMLGTNGLPVWGWLLPLGLLLLIYPLNAWQDAPVFPTPEGALDGLPHFIALTDHARILDAGCGMGHGLQALRRAWPQASFYGLEWSWPLRLVSAVRCPWATVRRADIWAADWSGYDMVYLFQRPESMPRAMVKALTEMREHTWLVSLNFPLPDDIPATYHDTLPDGRGVYAYRMPIADIDHASVQASTQASELAELLPPRPQGIVVQGQALYPRKRVPVARHKKS